MKIGKMFRWYWQNTYWGLVGFYGAMLFLMLLGFVIMVFSSTEEVSVNGFAFSAEIMLDVYKRQGQYAVDFYATQAFLALVAFYNRFGAHFFNKGVAHIRKGSLPICA